MHEKCFINKVALPLPKCKSAVGKLHMGSSPSCLETIIGDFKNAWFSSYRKTEKKNRLQPEA